VPISGRWRPTGLILPGAEGPRTAYVAVRHFETDGNASLRINLNPCSIWSMIDCARSSRRGSHLIPWMDCNSVFFPRATRDRSHRRGARRAHGRARGPIHAISTNSSKAEPASPNARKSSPLRSAVAENRSRSMTVMRWLINVNAQVSAEPSGRCWTAMHWFRVASTKIHLPSCSTG
jgi:hypothetical protein